MLVPPGAVERPTGCIQRFFDEGGASRAPFITSGLTSHAVARPTRFEEHRWLGDKRSMRVHDLDATTDALYQEVRGIAALSTVEQGVARFRRLAPKAPVTARSTLHRLNFRELPRLIGH